jgi:hypothetical protein
MIDVEEGDLSEVHFDAHEEGVSEFKNLTDVEYIETSHHANTLVREVDGAKEEAVKAEAIRVGGITILETVVVDDGLAKKIDKHVEREECTEDVMGKGDGLNDGGRERTSTNFHHSEEKIDDNGITEEG